MRAPLLSALAALLLGLTPEASAISGGHGGGPPVPPPRGRPVYTPPRGSERYLVGDYAQWWHLNRDEFLLELKPADALAEYEGAPPDTVQSLLALVGFEGHFASIVKELGLRRLRRTPKVADALVAILKDEKAPDRQRAWAAYALGDLQKRQAIPDLFGTLKSKDRDLRAFSALALGRMEDDASWEALVPLAVDPKEDQDVRCLVILALAPSALPKAREALTGLASPAKADAPAPVRRAALMALGVKAQDADRKLLTEACEDKDPQIQSAALIGLGLAGQGDGTIRRHLAAKAKGADQTVKPFAALALGITGSPDNADALIACLEQSKDLTTRGCAALALGRVKAPKTREALEKILHDRNASFVSDYAAVALGLTRDAKALPPLVQGLEGKSSELIIACVVGLSILGDKGALEPLLKAADHKHYSDVREFAAVALGRLRDEKGFPKLVAGLKDASPTVRHACAIGLAVYGDAKACPELEKLLADKDPLVRSGAALAFDLLTDDSKRKLTLGDELKGDPRSQTSRQVGLKEISRLLNRYLPKEYKLPITP